MRMIVLFCCTLLPVLLAPALRAAEWGNLTGQFVLSGKEPAPVALPVPPGAGCGAVALVDESLMIGPVGGIKNIVVYLYLKEGEKAPAAHADYEKTAKDSVALDNQRCRFEPHIVLLRTTQTLVVGNKDLIPHSSNLHFLENKPAALIVPAMGSIKVECPKRERLPATANCAIHPWMGALMVVRDNPYLALTGEDGTFTMKNVPAGDWTFQFWHERCGFLAKELKQGGKPLTWIKGRPEFTIGAKPTDIGKIEVGVEAFKKK